MFSINVVVVEKVLDGLFYHLSLHQNFHLGFRATIKHVGECLGGPVLVVLVPAEFAMFRTLHHLNMYKNC